MNENISIYFLTSILIQVDADYETQLEYALRLSMVRLVMQYKIFRFIFFKGLIFPTSSLLYNLIEIRIFHIFAKFQLEVKTMLII